MSYLFLFIFFFFKQKTAYEMVMSDWSSDVCSSDLRGPSPAAAPTSCCVRHHKLSGWYRSPPVAKASGSSPSRKTGKYRHRQGGPKAHQASATCPGSAASSATKLAAVAVRP